MKTLRALPESRHHAEFRRFTLGLKEFGVLAGVMALLLFLTAVILWPLWR